MCLGEKQPYFKVAEIRRMSLLDNLKNKHFGDLVKPLLAMVHFNLTTPYLVAPKAKIWFQKLDVWDQLKS